MKGVKSERRWLHALAAGCFAAAMVVLILAGLAIQRGAAAQATLLRARPMLSADGGAASLQGGLVLLAAGMLLLIALFVAQWSSRFAVETHAAAARAHAAGAHASAQALREEVIQAQNANRIKTSFLASLSHEIRTPLNVILGFSQFLNREGTLTPQQSRAVDAILRSGEHLLTLLNNVLEMARIEAGRVSLKTQPFDLTETIHTVQLLMRGPAEAKGLAFQVVMQQGLFGYIQADEGKLRQILLNLLDNAVKFTERGRVELRVTQSGEGDSLRLICEVEDSGVGLSPAEIELLFKPFAQAGREGAARSGTGLGLAISLQFAQLMGGDIRVVSTPGSGSTFAVTLPVKPLESVALPEVGKGRAVRALVRDGPVPRILNVDDEPLNRAMLSMLLRRLGFNVRDAADGPTALQLAASWRPDLMLLDLAMPGMDGLEVLRRVRADNALRRTQVMILTAHAFGDERQQVLAAGACDFVRKPFRIDDLLHVIAQYVRVQYDYDDVQKALPDAAPPEDFAALPDALRERLSQAASLADLDALESLCGDVQQVSAAHAGMLRGLIGQFDYTGILRRVAPQARES